jgi:hypothetical protein
MSKYLLKLWRREINRLIINVPPRTAKSTLVTICFPAWAWAHDPRHRHLTAGFSKDLSSKRRWKRGLLISTLWFQSLWPIEFSEDTNRADQCSCWDRTCASRFCMPTILALKPSSDWLSSEINLFCFPWFLRS